MTDRITQHPAPEALVDAELRLAGVLDNRMIGLLKAIEQTGSINQAAKQTGLSYKGAWQIIERANNGAPKTLVNTAIGGSKGGGTCLTDAGKSLVRLFTELEQRHQQFLAELNRDLAADADILLLLQRLIVKTSVRNQLFGTVKAIKAGAVHAEVIVELKGGESIAVNIGMTDVQAMGLRVDADAVILLNPSDILLITDAEQHYLVSNRLPGRVVRIRKDEVSAEVMLVLSGGEMLSVSLTAQSLNDMSITEGQNLWAIFNSQAPILGQS